MSDNDPQIKASTPPAEGAATESGAAGTGEGGGARRRHRNRRGGKRGRGERLGQPRVEGATPAMSDEGDPPPAAAGRAFDAIVNKGALNPEDAPKLHKVLADAGIGSRREMEELILAGRISVNGEPAHIGQRVLPSDTIRINGKQIMRKDLTRPPRIVLYHKPAGEIVSHDDPNKRPRVFDVLPRVKTGKWMSVGRLDFNTEGLLVFTNSGEIVNRLAHPRFGLEREYAVRFLGEMSEEQRQQLLDGVQLDDGPAKFASIENAGGEGANQWARVVISEGRNREVRRMFDAVNLPVSRLIRIRFGGFVLPPRLKRGQWMELDPDTCRALQSELGLGPKPKAEPDEEDGNRMDYQPPKPRGRREKFLATHNEAGHVMLTSHALNINPDAWMSGMGQVPGAPAGRARAGGGKAAPGGKPGRPGKKAGGARPQGNGTPRRGPQGGKKSAASGAEGGVSPSPAKARNRRRSGRRGGKGGAGGTGGPPSDA
ncbi:MAG TPA: pseudouridine synthase [Burkholderiaceae bacterium]|nr:pseudouridine synthase [Burkholderiaceae bacterium]